MSEERKLLEEVVEAWETEHLIPYSLKERIKAELAKPVEVFGYTGIGLKFLYTHEYNQLQGGIKALYNIPLYTHLPVLK